MKPFNLTKVLEGKQVLIINPAIKTNDRFVFEQLVRNKWRNNQVEIEYKSVLNSGVFVSDLNGKSTCTDLQLAMVPKKVKKIVYVNLYISKSNPDLQSYWYQHSTVEEAKISACPDAFAVAVPVTIECEEE